LWRSTLRVFMFCGRVGALWSLAVLTALTVPANCQSVISTHSGVVHYFEGSVYLGDQLLESHPGKFAIVTKGAELRTAQGRAEVLLTPGVFLRLGEGSAMRMVDNDLSHTLVELLSGSAVVDSDEQKSVTSVSLLYKHWTVRFGEQGVYRIDCEPPRLWVLEGKAEVSTDGHDAPVSVRAGMYMPFAAVLLPQQAIDSPPDALSAWSEGRHESISADNAIAANIQDPASMDASVAGPDSFTYFPMLGLPSLGQDLSTTYDALGLSRPGFNSLYLPGFTFLPVLLGIGTRPVGVPPARFPSIYTHPIPVRPIYPHPIPTRPTAPSPHPTTPVHVFTGGVHVGGRR
jgi:hypothetical protein